MVMFQSQLKTKLQKFFEPRLPGVACEIGRHSISLVRLGSKLPLVVDRFAVTPLPSGLIVPSLTQLNIKSTEALVSAIRSTLAKADIKAPRISLAIPDASAKVTIHFLDMLPPHENEVQQLLKWRLKKTIPFSIEDSHLSYLKLRTTEGKHIILTVNIHKDVLAQYEQVFQILGIHVGYVSLSSFASFELLVRLDAEVLQKSVLLLQVRPTYISSMIVQKGAVVLFRHVDHAKGDEVDSVRPPSVFAGVTVADLYAEIHPCLMYYQDKLSSQPIDKIYLSCPQDPQSAMVDSLADQSRVPVLNLDPLRLFQAGMNGTLRNAKNDLCPSLGLALGRF